MSVTGVFVFTCVKISMYVNQHLEFNIDLCDLSRGNAIPYLIIQIFILSAKTINSIN